MTNTHTTHMLALMNDLLAALIEDRTNDDLTAHANMLYARDELEFAYNLLLEGDATRPLARNLLDLAYA